MYRKEFLDMAEKCICNNREIQYGTPEDNFAIIAEYWNTYLKRKYSATFDINSYDVALMMTLFKLARLTSGDFKEDSIVDAIGYLACAGEVNKQ